MSPCSLCGANAINPACMHCEIRIDFFTTLTESEQHKRVEADLVRGVPKTHAPAAELVQRARDHREQAPNIGLVGCGKRKLNHRAIASELYTGNLFRAALRYSKKHFDETYVLSAAFGLVNLQRIIPPYDKGMVMLNKAAREIWGENVVNSLIALFPVRRLQLHFLAGSTYIDPVVQIAEREAFSWTIHQPLKGLMLGQRLRWFKQAAL